MGLSLLSLGVLVVFPFSSDLTIPLPLTITTYSTPSEDKGQCIVCKPHYYVLNQFMFLILIFGIKSSF